MTLVELLVTIAILALLVTLAVPALQNGLRMGYQSKATANLRQIGMAVFAYAGEHDQTLPGPLWPGQVPQLDPKRGGRLVRELAPWLNLEIKPAPYVASFFIPPAYRKNAPAGVREENWRTYVVNMRVATDSGLINPWGSQVLNPMTQPLRTPQIPNPSQIWAMTDADQQHPHVADASWKLSTPAKPIHGKHRITLFFDGSVARMAATDF